MTKSEKIKYFLELSNTDIDNTFWILQLKLIGLLEIQRVKDNYFERIAVTREDMKNITEFMIEVDSDKLKKSIEIITSELRMSFINHLYLNIATLSIWTRALIDDKTENDPAITGETIDKAVNLLFPFISKQDKAFLEFFHLVRNSMIHYNGCHNKRNPLNYIFCGTHFLTTKDNLGKGIVWNVNELIELYNSIKNIYNPTRFLKNPFLLRRLI